jgi:hypothetical protein
MCLCRGLHGRLIFDRGVGRFIELVLCWVVVCGFGGVVWCGWCCSRAWVSVSVECFATVGSPIGLLFLGIASPVEFLLFGCASLSEHCHVVFGVFGWWSASMVGFGIVT